MIVFDLPLELIKKNFALHTLVLDAGCYPYSICCGKGTAVFLSSLVMAVIVFKLKLVQQTIFIASCLNTLLF